MFQQHFNKLLLTALIIFFTAIVLVILLLKGESESFKWAIGVVGGLVGALLMMMRNDGTAPEAPVMPPINFHFPEGTFRPASGAAAPAAQPNGSSGYVPTT